MFTHLLVFASKLVTPLLFLLTDPSCWWHLFQSHTGKYPFHDIARDVTVILKVMIAERPTRPTADMGRMMSDELWNLVEVCWKQDPAERPEMVDVVERMVQVLAAS